MAAKCPICAKPVHREHRPFCSARCQSVDLGRWLGGVYAIPAEPAAPEEIAAARAALGDDGRNGDD